MSQKIIDQKKPLYIKIKEIIQEQIDQNMLQPGDKLLSEAQFQNEFDVSRITVRKAIDELIKEDYVTRIHGKGTFVKSQKSSLRKSLSLTDVCKEQGKELTSDVIFSGIIDTPNSLEELFNDNVSIKIKRVRKIDGVVIMLENIFLSPNHKFVLDYDLSGSLHKILNKHDVYPDYKGQNLVSIQELNDTQSKLFNVQAGMSVIHHNGTVYDKDNNLIFASDELVRVDLPDLFKYYL